VPENHFVLIKSEYVRSIVAKNQDRKLPYFGDIWILVITIEPSFSCQFQNGKVHFCSSNGSKMPQKMPQTSQK
jgi:hypothetical protein